MFTIITYGNIFFLSFIIESNSLYGYILIQYSFSVLIMIIIFILSYNNNNYKRSNIGLFRASKNKMKQILPMDKVFNA